MAGLVRDAMLHLSAGQRLADRARRALGVLKSFQLRWKLPTTATSWSDSTRVWGWADSGMLDHDLAGLFIEVGELAKTREVGILCTIDEIQYMEQRDLSALIVGLHRISQEQLPFMVVGAGLPSLLARVGEAKPYSERLFTFRIVNSLADAEAKAALAVPAEAEGVRWHPEALERVVATTGGYPYFLQEFGKRAWEMADGPDEITPPTSKPLSRSLSTSSTPGSSRSGWTGPPTPNAPT